MLTWRYLLLYFFTLMVFVATNANIGPVPNPLLSYWLSDDPLYQDTRTTPELPKENRVIIIGAGITGCSTAYELVHLGVPVTLIDARGVAGGATSRNSGGIGSGISFSDIEKYGVDRARQLLHLKDQHFQEYINFHQYVCKTSKQSCWMRVNSSISAFLDDSLYKQTKHEIQEQQKVGLGENISFWDKADCNTNLGAGQLAGCKYSSWNGNVWAAKLTFAMITIAFKTGLLNLQTNTMITSVEVNPNGNGFRVQTMKRGYVQADQVVFATNAYTGDLLPYFVDQITPARGQAIATQPLPTLWPYDFGTDLGDAYGHQQPDGPIIFGGLRRITPDQEFNNKDDSVLSPLISAGLISFLPLVFSSIASAGINPKPMYEWTGIMGFSKDGKPWAGQIPTKLSGREGLWVCAGFTGGGVTNGYLLGRAIGSWMTTGNKPEWWINNAFYYDDYLPSVERFNSKTH